MTTETALFTLETMPIDDRLELVDGRIVPKVSPISIHSLVQANLIFALKLFARQRALGVALSEFSLLLRKNPDTVRIPDVSFISRERWPEPKSKRVGTIPPELVVEIISPSNSYSEMSRKIGDYFAFGVDFVWIIDPDLCQVDVYAAPNALVRYSIDDTILGEGVLDGFSLPVKELFEDYPEE